MAVGVLVAYDGDEETAKGIAMQIAAMRPSFLNRDDVPAETVENERRIAETAAKEEGKPEQAIPKIVEGRVNAFFKDNVLLELKPSALPSAHLSWTGAAAAAAAIPAKSPAKGAGKMAAGGAASAAFVNLRNGEIGRGVGHDPLALLVARQASFREMYGW